MTAKLAVLDDLRAAAEAAAAVEEAFRREAASRIAQLEQERAFAFRRLNLIAGIAEAAASAESEEMAVAHALAALRARLGWTSESEARSEVLSRFTPIVRALHCSSEPSQVREALAAFEAWYLASRGTPFWTLLAQDMPETPLVDF